MDEQKTPRVDLVCILVLSIEWVFFGSMHFTRLHETAAEIPDFFHSWKPAIVVVTGMVEVTTGIFVLLRRTRRGAAVTSLVLLAAFVPSIFKMLVSDAAMAGFSPWMRVILVPNHVVLALAAVHLLQSGAPTTGTAQLLEQILARDRGRARSQERPRRRPPGPYRTTLIIAGVMMLANLAGFGVITPMARSIATVHLWGMMCLATGALVGFLFAVPRVSADPKRVTHRPNSNIEVLSDWLTKIIVGVGLIEFRQLGGFLTRTSGELAQALVPRTSPAFAQALIIYFFVAGVIQGYLLTRLYLSREFEAWESRGERGETPGPRQLAVSFAEAETPAATPGP
jgi:uncharacterized membrane protein